jgi:hypothetical protein
MCQAIHDLGLCGEEKQVLLACCHKKGIICLHPVLHVRQSASLAGTPPLVLDEAQQQGCLVSSLTHAVSASYEAVQRTQRVQLPRDILPGRLPVVEGCHKVPILLQQLLHL